MTEEGGSIVQGRRVTLVHDYLTEVGGAERVVGSLLSMFPEAELHTAAFDPLTMGSPFDARDVRTTFLRRLAADKSRARRIFPLFPIAFRRLRLSPTDVVLSSSSGFAHHVRPPVGAIHACYCYAPPRFLWQPELYLRGRPVARTFLTPALAAMRAVDRRAAARVDEYIAVSRHTASRIHAVYGREATVIHPPVAVDRFRPTAERSGRFLVLSRLMAYKRVDLAVRAAALAGLPLDVIGDGPERARLERSAGPTVRFLGRLPDDAARDALARCIALIVPGTEDFGMTPVEAQASGRPPICLAAGGALETVEDGVTGFLVDRSTPEAFAAAMVHATRVGLPARRLVAAARRFDEATFRQRLGTFLEVVLERRMGSSVRGSGSAAFRPIATPAART